MRKVLHAEGVTCGRCYMRKVLRAEVMIDPIPHNNILSTISKEEVQEK